MLTSARRVAAALLAATVCGAGPASAQPEPSAADVEAGVAAAALYSLAEALAPVSGSAFASASVTAAPPQPVGRPGGPTDAHVLRFPHVRVASGGRLLSASPVDVIVLRLSDDLFEIRAELPGRMDYLLDQTYLGALTISEQAIRGVWSNSLRMFVELDVSLREVRTAETACDGSCRDRLAGQGLTATLADPSGPGGLPERSIGSFDWYHGLTEQEAERWSGLVRFAAENLVWPLDQGGPAQSIGQISLEADVRSVDLLGIRQLVDQWPDPGAVGPPDDAAVSDLLEAVPPLLEGGSITVRMNDLSLDAGRPGADAGTRPGGLEVERVGGRIAIDGLAGGDTQMQLSFAYSAPGLADGPDARLADLVPETLSMAAEVARIPSAHAWQEIRQSLVAPALLSQVETEMAILGGLIGLGATPEAHWSIGPVRADYADWSMGIEGTMSLTGPPMWDVTGGFDLLLQDIDRPMARLPDHPVDWLRERGSPVVQALRDIALPGPAPGSLMVRVDLPEHGSVFLNGHELTTMLE